jgi:hypothetical protein
MVKPNLSGHVEGLPETRNSVTFTARAFDELSRSSRQLVDDPPDERREQPACSTSHNGVGSALFWLCGKGRG